MPVPVDPEPDELVREPGVVVVTVSDPGDVQVRRDTADAPANLQLNPLDAKAIADLRLED